MVQVHCSLHTDIDLINRPNIKTATMMQQVLRVKLFQVIVADSKIGTDCNVKGPDEVKDSGRSTGRN